MTVAIAFLFSPYRRLVNEVLLTDEFPTLSLLRDGAAYVVVVVRHISDLDLELPPHLYPVSYRLYGPVGSQRLVHPPCPWGLTDSEVAGRLTHFQTLPGVAYVQGR